MKEVTIKIEDCELRRIADMVCAVKLGDSVNVAFAFEGGISFMDRVLFRSIIGAYGYNTRITSWEEIDGVRYLVIVTDMPIDAYREVAGAKSDYIKVLE